MTNKIANVLVVGATSAIAQGVIRYFAKDGCSLYLTGRNHEKLEIVAKDSVVCGAKKVETLIADLEDPSKADGIVEQALKSLGTLDAVLIAHGVLPEQSDCDRDYSVTEKVFRVNFLSVVALTTRIVSEFEMKGQGTLAVISSVAADRGRGSNYVYGATKSALDCYLSGLRNRVFKKGIHVLTIKPGLVATPMVGHLKPSILFASPDAVGRKIYDSMIRKVDILYVPAYWRLILGIVKMIPEWLFKRLSL